MAILVSRYMSQSPQTGQFNSYKEALSLDASSDKELSQSPQTGQFNSYWKYTKEEKRLTP